MISQALDLGLSNVNWANPLSDDGLNDGVIACYIAEDQSWGSNRWFDLSPYGNDATLTNMDPTTDWDVNTYDGGFGSVDFDGSDDSSRADHNSIFPTDNFTIAIAAYVHGPGGGSSGRVVSKRNSNIQYDWILNQSLNQFNSVNASSNPSLDTWYQHAVTFKGGTVQHYMDGKTNGSGSGSVTEDTGAGFWIGDLQLTPRPFDGKVAYVRVYNRVLTADEVFGLYLEHLTGCPNLFNRISVPLGKPPAASSVPRQGLTLLGVG